MAQQSRWKFNMKLFAFFREDEFLGSLRSFDGSGLRLWAIDFYKCPANLLKVYELVEVK